MTKSSFIKNLQAAQEQLQNKHQNIRQNILNHLGKYAILIEKRGRHSLSFFIRITGRCTGEYKCYDFEGKFRCYLTKYLDIRAMLIGEQTLVYLDDM